jgi:hypothetical protein
MPDSGAGMSGWRIALNIVGAMMLVVFGSCAFCVYMAGQKKSDDEARTARAAENTPVAPTPPSPPSGLSGTVSVANFTKDTRLDECDDFTITVPPEVDGGEEVLSKNLEAVSQSFVKMKKKSTGLSRIGKPCTEQFRTARALAACTAHWEGDSGSSLTVDMTSRYYNLDTITGSDTYMKGCIDMQGDWQAAEKDSDEYREALRARARREVEKATRQLEKMQGAAGQ